MSGSSWVLVVLVSKHRQVSLRPLDIDRSTLTGLLGFFFISWTQLHIDRSAWVLVVISYSRVVAARRCSTVVH